jgi:hypothetical protein
MDVNGFLVKYAVQILSMLALIGITTGGYYYWKHSIVNDALLEQSAKLTEQSEALLKQKTFEIQQAREEEQRRHLNAIKTYADHYEELRIAADAAPKRVFVATKTNCSGDSMQGGNKGGPGTSSATAGVNWAELPERNIQQLNEVIGHIELMQLKCEQLLNTVP